jgi:molybdate transport system permease protein
MLHHRSHRRALFLGPRSLVRLVRGAALVCSLTLSATIGWPSPVDAQAREEPQRLLVLAASSLTDVLPTLASDWAKTTGASVRFAFDATSRLAPQAAAGAPADVFVSADREWMSWLVAQGLVTADAPRVIAENELVLVVRAGTYAPTDPNELLGLKSLALAGENVPAGRYARQALTSSGIDEDQLTRWVTGGSVRGVLEWVARGEVEAGVVYRTDVLAEPDVEVAFVFPSESHEPIRYWAAPLVDSPSPDAGRSFVAFLSGPAGEARLESAGFRPSTIAPGLGVLGEVGSTTRQVPGGNVMGAVPSPGSAVRLSIIVALLSTVFGLVPAIALGWLLARRNFRGKTLVSTMVLAPLVIPPVVTGFLLLSLLGTQSPLGGALASVGLPIPFTLLGAIIAAFVVGMPLYVLSIRGAFEAIDPLYEELSWTLGVRPRETFLRVSLPLALPGIAAGATLAFARSLGEFGATVVLAGNVEGDTRTIALAVYTLLEAPTGRETIWILVGASVALSLLALLGFEMLSRRQRRRLESDHAR